MPFWAPPSSGAKRHGLDKIVNATYNKKVQVLSREKGINEVEDNIEKNTAWVKEGFEKERLNFLMTLSDAKNCTFYPKTGSNIPEKHKTMIKNHYPSWANEMLEHKADSFEEWVNKMGDNFSRRFPTIYKFGKFKRAVNFLRRDLFIKAYKEIADAFNIESIKKELEINYDPEK